MRTERQKQADALFAEIFVQQIYWNAYLKAKERLVGQRRKNANAGEQDT